MEQELISQIVTEDQCGKMTPEEACDNDVLALKAKAKIKLSKEDCREEFQLLCRAVSQFKATTNATLYVKSAFKQVKEEFLSVIDHFETEDEETDEDLREEHNEGVNTELKIAYSKVSKQELEIVSSILKQVEVNYPKLKETLKRHKRLEQCLGYWDGEFIPIIDN